MIVHMVSFKYKADADGAARQDHRRRLGTLADIDGILDFKLGEDILHTKRSYDTGLIIIFRDRDALAGYARHPRHVPVSELGSQLSEHIVAVDFEM
jgi:hypothetical protein